MVSLEISTPDMFEEKTHRTTPGIEQRCRAAQVPLSERRLMTMWSVSFSTTTLTAGTMLSAEGASGSS